MYNKLIKKIRKFENIYKEYTHEQILNKTEELRKLSQQKSLDKFLPEAFALCVVASQRVLGMRHFDVQLMGGISLHKGRIAEMKTGEGKTLVATCPVYLNALKGEGVHVITVNDYLAKRDSSQMGEVFEYLGMTCGCIYTGMPFNERKEAYQCDITYGTNSEFGFDYLRDNLAKTTLQQVQRGLDFVIIDEVDSVLIDDSKTPLIISGSEKESSDIYISIDKIVKSLKKTTNYNPDATMVEKMLEENDYNGDYLLNEKTKDIVLTDSGVEKVEKFLGKKLSEEGSLLSHYITQSLKANYTMAKDVDYVIKNDKVVIVDSSTGRLQETRKFSDGLHQAIEAKENVPISEENITHGTVTYQNFFRMYKKISGMTGTAYSAKYELKSIYNLVVDRIPTNKPVIRIDADDALYPTKKQKYENMMKEISSLHQKGQPILIGTPSVEESEIVSKLLKNNGYSFNVLNAKNHEKEAEIIAQAGTFDAITVATNMAGRGTDILLGGNPSFEIKKLKKKLELGEITKEDYDYEIEFINADHSIERQKVVNAGGLAVIGVERFDNRRIDDQLKGRAGRQGDPGYSKFFLSLEDKMFSIFGNVRFNNNLDFSYSPKITKKMIRNAQIQIENFSYSSRKNTLNYDDVNDTQRKQIYQIRKDIMSINDEQIMCIFEKYEDEICKKLAQGTDDLNIFFRTQNAPIKDVLSIREYINDTIVKNEENLKTYNNTIANMIRFIMLSTVDRRWIDYINQTISLKETVGITVMGSLKPIQLYKTQSIKMFNELIDDIKKEIIRSVANIKIEPKTPKLKISISL